MFKSAFIGFLLGVAAVGIFWFFFGRPDIKRVRTDLNTVNRVFEELQRTSDQVTTDASGLTGNIAAVNTEAKRAVTGIDGLIKNNNINTGQIEFISSGINTVEQVNIELIHLGRDVGNLAFDLRRLSETYGNGE